MITKDEIVKFYSYFYKKRFNSLKYTYKPSDKAEKVIDTFIKKLDKTYNLKLIGESFLWDYFIYQFNYWRDAKLQAFYGQFRIELIIGNKAFKRWFLDEKGDHWVIEKSEIISLYGFNKNDLISHENSIYKGNYEVKIKELKYNTDEGFYNCLSLTTLFNHRHKCCMLCNFKNECIKTLKETMPKIYNLRGY